MNSITITKDQAKAICFDYTEEFSVIESGDWISEGKYQYKEVIFSKGESENYSLEISRSGSPFTVYEYSWKHFDEFVCRRVKKIEIKTHKWVPINE